MGQKPTDAEVETATRAAVRTFLRALGGRLPHSGEPPRDLIVTCRARVICHRCGRTTVAEQLQGVDEKAHDGDRHPVGGGAPRARSPQAIEAETGIDEAMIERLVRGLLSRVRARPADRPGLSPRALSIGSLTSSRCSPSGRRWR